MCSDDGEDVWMTSYFKVPVGCRVTDLESLYFRSCIKSCVVTMGRIDAPRD